MKLSFKVTLAALQVIFAATSASAQISDFGDLDRNRLPSELWQNSVWSNPGGWTTINVTQNGLPANSSIDASSAVQSILSNNSGRIRLYFPAGDYTFNSNLVLTRGDIWISGDGPATKFVLDAPSFEELNIRFQGSPDVLVSVNESVERGEKSFTLSDASAFGSGDYVEIFAANSGLKSNAEAGQIARVTGKSGNTITINDKFGVPITTSQQPKARRLNLVGNIRVEDIRIERVRDNGGRSFNLHFDHARNILVRDIESFKSAKHHIELLTSYETIIEDSVFDDNWDNGGGGHGYGISGVYNATKARITNNTLTNLRHPLNVHFGANHFIFAYNSATSQDGHRNAIIAHGRGAHNNLFEGNFSTANILKDCAHLADWQFNTFFRNRGKNVGDECSTNDLTNIIGNEYTDNLRTSGSGNYIGGNLSVGGSVTWGDLPVNADIPPSLFANMQPAYVASWPLYGPGTSAPTTPAGGSLIAGVTPTKQSTNWSGASLSKLTDGMTNLEAYTNNSDDAYLQWNFVSDKDIDSVRFYQDNAGSRQLKEYRIRLRRNGTWTYQGDWVAADQSGWQEVAITSGSGIERIQIWFRPESGGNSAAYEVEVLGTP